MKKLILAEKPSVARNIADATKASRKDGYFEGDSYIITWAFGHLLQLYDAVDYDPSMKIWRMDRFPFIPDHFQYKLKSDQAKKKTDAGAARQMKIIKQLMGREDVEGIHRNGFLIGLDRREDHPRERNEHDEGHNDQHKIHQELVEPCLCACAFHFPVPLSQL